MQLGEVVFCSSSGILAHYANGQSLNRTLYISCDSTPSDNVLVSTSTSRTDSFMNMYSCVHRGLGSLLLFLAASFPSPPSSSPPPSPLSAVQILSFYLYEARGNIYPGPLKQAGYGWASSQLVKLAAARCLLMSL